MGWLIDEWTKIDKNKKKIEFVKLGTIHWMSALKLLCENNFSGDELERKYKHVIRKNTSDESDIYSVSHLLMSLHYLSALNKMGCVKNEAVFLSRSAIVTWYYGICFGAKAMLSATDNSQPASHLKTANCWDNQLCENDRVVFPFNYRVSNLVKKNYEDEISKMSNANRYDNKCPKNEEQSMGCCCSYLKGTAKWYRENEEKKIKKDNKEIINFLIKEN